MRGELAACQRALSGLRSASTEALKIGLAELSSVTDARTSLCLCWKITSLPGLEDHAPRPSPRPG